MEKLELEELVKKGMNEEVKNILQNTDFSKLVDGSGMTVLHLAAKHNNLELLKYLLAIGLDINAKTSFNSTPLAIAVFFNRFEVVKLLLQSNADIFGADSEGRSTMRILMSKIKKLPEDVVAHVIENSKRSNLDREIKANVFIEAGCRLEFVLLIGDHLVTLAFLERSNHIELNELNVGIRFAMKRQDAETIRVFLEYMHRRNISKQEFFWKLHYFFTSETRRNLNMAEFYVKRSMDWNIIDKKVIRCYESMFAIVVDEESLQVLLNTNIDVYVRDKFGIELLLNLFYNSEIDVIELVRKRSFDVNGRDTDGNSALHIVVQKVSKKNVRFLLNMGADPNAKNNKGQTPFHENVIYGNSSYVELLLHHGANVQLSNQPDAAFADIYNCNIRNSIKTVIAQLAVDEARGVPIGTRYRAEFRLNYSTYKKCSQQIKELKEYGISDSMSFFTVLTAKAEDIARRLPSGDYLPKLAHYFLEHSIIFFYYSTLKFKLLRVSKIFCAKSNLAKIVSQKTGISVGYDHLVIEKISIFLTYYDMQQLSQFFDV